MNRLLKLLGLGRDAERPPRHADLGESKLVVKNQSALPVDIFINACGPFCRCAAGTERTVWLPCHQLQGSLEWCATHTIHAVHEVTLAKGSLGVKYGRKSCTLVVGRSTAGVELAQRLIGMGIGAYSTLVAAQLEYRRRAKVRAKAERMRQLRATKLIQRSVRAHLARSPRTCFICLEPVAWASMVSLVPKQRCHRTCKGCASQHVDHALAEGKLYVRCPGAGCKHLLDDAQVAALASREALEKQRENQRAANARRLADFEAEDGGFKSFCAEHARKCPACSVIIYRHAGCDHMHCRCGADFDWNKTPGCKLGESTASATPGPAVSLPGRTAPPRRRTALPRRLRAHAAARARREAEAAAEDDLIERIATEEWMDRMEGGEEEDEEDDDDSPPLADRPGLDPELGPLGPLAELPQAAAPAGEPAAPPRPTNRAEEQAQLEAAIHASLEFLVSSYTDQEA